MKGRDDGDHDAHVSEWRTHSMRGRLRAALERDPLGSVLALGLGLLLPIAATAEKRRAARPVRSEWRGNMFVMTDGTGFHVAFLRRRRHGLRCLQLDPASPPVEIDGRTFLTEASREALIADVAREKGRRS